MELTTRQVRLIITGLVMGFKLITLPPLLSQLADNDMWLVLVFSFLLDGAYLMLFLYFNYKCKGKTMVDYITQNYGKVISKIVCGIFLALWIIKTVLLIQEFYLFLTVALYEDLSIILYVTIMILCVLYLGSRRFRDLGRYAELFYYVVIAGIFLTILTSFNRVDVTNIFPILYRGTNRVIISSFKRCLWFGDYSILFVLIGNIKQENNFNKKIIGGWFFGVAVSLIVGTIFYMLYAKSGGLHYSAIMDIIQYFPIANSSNRLNSIIVVLWPLLHIWLIGFSGAVCNYSMKAIFTNKKQKNFCIYYVSALILAMLILTQFSYQTLVELIDSTLNYFIAPTLYGLPLLFLLMGGIKRLVKKRS